MENKNNTFDKYKNQVEDFTHKVMDDAEELGYKALDGMEDLGHKMIAGSEHVSQKACEGIHAVKAGTQKAIDKTLQGMGHLEKKMKNK